MDISLGSLSSFSSQGHPRHETAMADISNELKGWNFISLSLIDQDESNTWKKSLHVDIWSNLIKFHVFFWSLFKDYLKLKQNPHFKNKPIHWLLILLIRTNIFQKWFEQNFRLKN